jgi:hypothetical protein
LRFPIFDFLKIANWQLAIENGFGHLKLEFGAYLGFGICDLGFRTIDALCYALYEFGEYGPQIS